jgi:hypothetical protein
MASRAPDRTGKTPNKGGGHEDFTTGLGTARGAAEKELRPRGEEGGGGRRKGTGLTGGPRPSVRGREEGERGGRWRAGSWLGRGIGPGW